MRTKITLECTMETKKYCPFCRKHTLHKETR